MNWFSIDGYKYDVRIFKPKESFTILNNDNAGRTLAKGAPMVLSPIGTFFSYTLTFGKKNGKEDDFERLWEYLATPRKSPILFVFPKNSKEIWKTTKDDGEVVDGFYAYVSTGERDVKKVEETENGELKNVIYDVFSVKFTATKAQVLPND